MLKELLKNKLIEEIKTKTTKSSNKDLIEKIINNQLNLNDILDNIQIKDSSTEIKELLLNIIKNNSLNQNTKNIIYVYLITNGNNNQINLIMEELGYNYTINDITNIDKYLEKRGFNDNDLILNTIDKVWNNEQDKPNTLFKEKINKLKEFKTLIDNNLFPSDLINIFTKVKISKNLYWGLIEIEKVMQCNQVNKKDMFLIYLTYNFKLDNNLEEYFKNINLTKEDIIEFIKKLEEKDFLLDEKRLENLFKNFKYTYYQKNNLTTKYQELSNKIIKEYSTYYDNHFYFNNKDFIKHYNNLYHDDFSFFIFKDEFTPLTENILYSLFKQDSLLSNYHLFKDETSTLKTFKKLKLASDKYQKEQEDIYKKRKKFYQKYKCKINKFLSNEDICFKYFMIKYISAKDRGEFYELFKTLYKDTYKELEKRKVTTKTKATLLKKDFIIELSNLPFKDRYSIIDKYREYANYIECETHIKDNYYNMVIEELERKYYLFVAKNIVLRLEFATNNEENTKLLYKKIEEYVKKELLLTSIDELFNKLTKKHNDLKEKYITLKNSINKQKSSKKLNKRKSVKS